MLRWRPSNGPVPYLHNFVGSLTPLWLLHGAIYSEKWVNPRFTAPDLPGTPKFYSFRQSVALELLFIVKLNADLRGNIHYPRPKNRGIDRGLTVNQKLSYFISRKFIAIFVANQFESNIIDICVLTTYIVLTVLNVVSLYGATLLGVSL